ncbi:MAG TPA: glutaminyl-peptide cyclotransferase [Thermoanaerobaculia bacterium]|nr:glutaminyl-peptide cyclotransferase [Thermoanaerobaculia bacterium]
MRGSLWARAAALGIAPLALLAILCSRAPATPRKIEPGPTPPAHLRARIVAVYPHDPQAFTQGLLWHRGALYESTGQYGASSLREVELASGKVLRRADLPRRLFGEGLARVEDRLIQLTWQEGVALVWGAADFARRGELAYTGEGWGLCFDGRRLVMSDGSSRLLFRDPRSFAVVGELDVASGGVPAQRLNELECVAGAIYANVWRSDEILRIDPATGRVTAVVDASGLLARDERRGADVLNGIAHRPETGTFLVTGKYWPKLFEVVFEPAV